MTLHPTANLAAAELNMMVDNKMEINIPKGVQILKETNVVKIMASASHIIEVSNQIRNLSKLPVGAFALLNDIELFVASAPSRFPHRISMPSRAWNIVASKFIEVATGWEESPFNFNDCGFLRPKLPLDLGVILIGEVIHE